VRRDQPHPDAGLSSPDPYSRSVDPLKAFDLYTARLIAAVEGNPDVLGVVLAGSGAQPERIDEWSDHDFFLIVRQDPESWRRDVSWLPDADKIVIRAKEGIHGQKIVMADGHVLEFAVATVEEMAGWAVNHYQVVLDHGGVEEFIAGLAAATVVEPVDPWRELQLFLAILYIGVGRDRRGEVLAAGRFVRAYALEHLLAAWRALLPPQVGALEDSLDVHRRFELAYPSASAELAAAIAQRPEPAGRDLVAIAERHLAPGWDEWPALSVQAVRDLLGWSAGH
jgi:hypothetical protein